MKRLYIYISATLLLSATAALSAQESGTRPFKNVEMTREENIVQIKGEIDFNHFDLHRQQIAVITPVLRSLDGSQEFALEPVAIAGRTRYKVVNRESGFGNDNPVPYGADVTRVLKNRKPQVSFSQITPFRNWMYDAELIARVSITGCADAPYGNYVSVITETPFVLREEPTYTISYVVPPAEPVKQRSESYTAYINFAVNRSEIVRDFKDNAAELAKVDKIISELRNDSNLNITELRVTGYASPEGTAASNLKLSENRTRAFVDYLLKSHTIDRSIIRTDWKGDDWEGLRKAMTASNFPSKDRVISIIDNTADVARRKTELKNLGNAYTELLAIYYPPLRRTEYSISYVARPFNIDEARELITTKPQHLSLNEMYLVANSYERDDPRFKQVFDIASRMYPSDPYARTNSAAADIENGAYDAAISRLDGLDIPEALNNLGAAFAGKKDYQRALGYFRRASQTGLPAAAINTAALEQWLEETQ